MSGKSSFGLVLCLVVFLSSLILSTECYRHVIFMHGILAGKSEVKDFEMYLNQYHPGTNLSVIDKFQYLKSFAPLWKQVGDVRDLMAKIMSEHPEGVHLVCFSQGGLICRGVLETMPTHNVINFISLSSPQGGQYGTTNYLAPILPHHWTKDYYKLFYTKQGQKWSIANYWNDPHEEKLFFKWSNYLAVINNQSTTNNTFKPEFRENFLRLKNLVLVGGPDDGVITPWESSHFGVFNDQEKVVEMREQQLYKEDWFGLRTLDARRSLYFYNFSGVKHTDWHRNPLVFLKCIEPWLD